MVTKTELMAFEWLKKTKGYSGKEIIRQSNKTPDFICLDGKRYEVKLLYGNNLIFYHSQIKDLKNEDTILVFDRDRFLTNFLWGERNNTSFNIKIVQVEGTTIQIEKNTLNKLKKLRITKRETYDEILNRLMEKCGG